MLSKSYPLPDAHLVHMRALTHCTVGATALMKVKLKRLRDLGLSDQGLRDCW